MIFFKLIKLFSCEEVTLVMSHPLSLASVTQTELFQKHL